MSRAAKELFKILLFLTIKWFPWQHHLMSQKQHTWGHKSFRRKNKITKEAQNFTYLWFEVDIAFFVLYGLVSLSCPSFFTLKYFIKEKKVERFVPGISCWLLFRKQRIPAIMWTMQISPRPAWSTIPSPSQSWLRFDSALERLLGSVARGLYRNISVSLLLLPPSPGSKLQESNSSCYGNKHPTTARWGIL